MFLPKEAQRMEGEPEDEEDELYDPPQRKAQNRHSLRHPAQAVHPIWSALNFKKTVWYI